MTIIRARKRVAAARDRVGGEISDNASHGRIASAMAAEGYAGGYRDAEPAYGRGYWRGHQGGRGG